MNCRKCNKEMKKLPQGFDAFTFINPVEPMYCQNDECERYGDVTVMGISSQPKKEDCRKSTKMTKNKNITFVLMLFIVTLLSAVVWWTIASGLSGFETTIITLFLLPVITYFIWFVYLK